VILPGDWRVKPLVLLVDDDQDLLTALRMHLRAQGWDVLTAATILDGQRLLREHLPHVMVVDLRLPDGCGLDLARELRQVADVPVIVLTAVDNEDVMVMGLREIADDYVTKPFSARELSARIASVMRRAWPSGHPMASTLRLGNGLIVDFVRRRVQSEHVSHHLTPTESRLLWLLAGNAGHVLTTQTLLDRVWPAGEGSLSSLWEYIRRLREKLGDDPAHPHYIITERDIGYRFQIESRDAQPADAGVTP